MDDQYGFAVRQDDLKLKEAWTGCWPESGRTGRTGKCTTGGFPSREIPVPCLISFERRERVLNFGTAAAAEPMSYVFADQGAIGFDIEYAAYIAQDLGMELNIVNMEFGALLPARSRGR